MIRGNLVVNSRAGGGIAAVVIQFIELYYNDVWNNFGGNYIGLTAGAHDISADPLFINSGSDFHLSAGSPCIDAGDPSNYPPTDFDGQARPHGSAADIGADEYYAK